MSFNIEQLFINNKYDEEKKSYFSNFKIVNVVLQKDKELTESILRKMLNESKINMTRLEKLEKYYLGQHDILLKSGYNVDVKPVVCSFPKYIVDTLTGYFIGEPITYLSDDEQALEQLNDILDYTDIAAEDTDIVKDVSIFGVGYELMYIDEEQHTRMARVSPLNMIVVYDDTV